MTSGEASMYKQEYTYRCPLKCPIHKKCFIIKVTEEIKEPLTVLQKCPASEADIKITIGNPRPP